MGDGPTWESSDRFRILVVGCGVALSWSFYGAPCSPPFAITGLTLHLLVPAVALVPEVIQRL
jgi:hypothetical protein